MRKLIALLLALAMLSTVSFALAGPSVTSNDVVKTGVTETHTAEAMKLLLKVAETQTAKNLLDKMLETSRNQNGSVAGVFPENLNVDSKAVIQEIISVVLNPDFPVVNGRAYSDRMTITADVSKAKDVRVLIGIEKAGAEDLTWFEGKPVNVEATGYTLNVTYPADAIAAMKNAESVTLVVLSVPAE